MVNLVRGWKAIADLLDVSVRTVQRYEREGLPVFRLGGMVCVEPRDMRSWLDRKRQITPKSDRGFQESA